MQMQTNFHVTRFEKEAKGNSEMAYWRPRGPILKSPETFSGVTIPFMSS